MFNKVRRQALIALCLMTFLVCGAAAAEASDTHGAASRISFCSFPK